MALTTLTTDLNYHQAQDDNPNDSGGMTAAQFKTLCDQGVNDVKSYINDTHLPELDAVHIPYQYGSPTSIKENMDAIVAGGVSDGSITTAKLADGAATFAKGGHGGTTAAGGVFNLINALAAVTPVSADKFPFLDASGATAGGVTLANLAAALQGAGIPKIATGSYTGNGKYGPSNPTSITLPFVPKLLAILANGTWGVALYIGGAMQGDAQNGTADRFYPLVSSLSGTTLSWYFDGTGYEYMIQAQCNSNGVTYHWFAIG